MGWTLSQVDMLVTVGCVCAALIIIGADVMRSRRRVFQLDFWILTAAIIMGALVAYLLVRPMAAWFLVKTFY